MNKLLSNELVVLLDKYSVPGQPVGTELKNLMDKTRNAELIIPVLGMQGMGKSTLINALLKEDIMPSEADETTCVPVEVKYGKEQKDIVYFANSSQVQEIKSKNDLYQYVDNNYNPANIKKVSRIVLYRDIELLKGGLTIVDLPGVGSLTHANEETTNRYIQNLCTAIFVIPTVPTIRRAEAMFIKSVWMQFPTAIFVQNRWVDDTDLAISESVEYNTMRLKQIAEQLNNPFDENIIVVNAYDGIAGALNNDIKKIKNSNINKLVDKINELSSNWETTMSAMSLQRFVNTLIFIKERIEDKLSDQTKSLNELKTENEERLSRFEKETTELNDKLKSLKKYLRNKEYEVQDLIDEKTNIYTSKLRAGINHIIDLGVVDGDKLTEAFNDIQTREAEELFDSLLSFILEMKVQIESQINQYEQSIDLNEAVNFEPMLFEKNESFKWEKGARIAFNIGGSVLSWEAGVAVSAKVGAVLGGPWGALVGAAVGICVVAGVSWATNKGKKQITKHRGEGTKEEIYSAITLSSENFKSVSNNRFEEFFKQSYDMIKNVEKSRADQYKALLGDMESSLNSVNSMELESDLTVINNTITNLCHE